MSDKHENWINLVAIIGIVLIVLLGLMATWAAPHGHTQTPDPATAAQDCESLCRLALRDSRSLDMDYPEVLWSVDFQMENGQATSYICTCLPDVGDLF